MHSTCAEKGHLVYKQSQDPEFALLPSLTEEHQTEKEAAFLTKCSA